MGFTNEQLFRVYYCRFCGQEVRPCDSEGHSNAGLLHHFGKLYPHDNDGFTEYCPKVGRNLYVKAAGDYLAFDPGTPSDEIRAAVIKAVFPQLSESDP
jgi:hypothetical protein